VPLGSLQQLSLAWTNFSEILYDDTQEGPRRMTIVQIGTGSRIPPLEGPLRFLCAIKIFSGNLVSMYGMKWSKSDSFENTIWRTAAMDTHNIPAVRSLLTS